MAYIGIDYGRLAGSNRDKETGIHYGVISQHTVGQAWYDEATPDYGEPTCPECGNVMQYFDEAIAGDWEGGRGCNDYMCESCKAIYDSSDAFGDEPNGWSYSGDGYELTDCLQSDIFVLKSPYYTFAQFCSPCVPGAGNLDSPIEEGVKTYCLGHDWFEEGKAPYPVFDVATGQQVSPDA